MKNVDVINFPFRSSVRFASTDGKKKKGENEQERGKGVEEKENRIPRLGQAGAKGEFSAISLSVAAAQRGARHQRRVKVIAGGCTSPILALRAANKPFRLFDTRNSVFLAILPAESAPPPGGKRISLSELATGGKLTSLFFFPFSFSFLSLSLCHKRVITRYGGTRWSKNFYETISLIKVSDTLPFRSFVKLA